ncbi:MAG: pyridoxal phosphate-dependent aminotransferase [Elusimicrobia bacterium]|nr:pyridoxal phosphate-dependent aminotransferase [Elusimicrobiota bacterium]
MSGSLRELFVTSLINPPAPSLSSRLSSLVIQSEIRAMTIECEKAGGINLAQGVCDTEVPLAIRRAAAQAMDEGVNSYTRYDGLAELRQAIADKLARDNGLSVNPDSEIVVSAGSTGAFYCACLALLNPGDEVILFEPYYGYHLNTLAAVDAVCSFVSLEPPNWDFRPADLEAAVTPKTKAIMVCTPANPSGKVFSRLELEQIAEIAIKHNLIIFTDEIYEYFVYDGARHISPATLAQVRDRTVTISGFSKTFSITGWRIGYSVCRSDWAKTIGYLNDLVYVCAPAPLQRGVAQGLSELPEQYYRDIRQEYALKRAQICEALNRAGFDPCVPNGSYYVLADASRLPGATGKEKAMYLLSKTGVAAVPGEAFFDGPNKDRFLRFCFAKSAGDLAQACERLSRFN